MTKHFCDHCRAELKTKGDIFYAVFPLKTEQHRDDRILPFSVSSESGTNEERIYVNEICSACLLDLQDALLEAIQKIQENGPRTAPLPLRNP